MQSWAEPSLCVGHYQSQALGFLRSHEAGCTCSHWNSRRICIAAFKFASAGRVSEVAFAVGFISVAQETGTHNLYCHFLCLLIWILCCNRTYASVTSIWHIPKQHLSSSFIHLSSMMRRGPCMEEYYLLLPTQIKHRGLDSDSVLCAKIR